MCQGNFDGLYSDSYEQYSHTSPPKLSHLAKPPLLGWFGPPQCLSAPNGASLTCTLDAHLWDGACARGIPFTERVPER